MERFTGKVTGLNSCGHAVPVTFAMDFVFGMTDRDFLQFQALLDRLYEYEETGLTPEEIKILHSAECEKVTQVLVEVVPQLVDAISENLPQLVELVANKMAREIQEGQP